MAPKAPPTYSPVQLNPGIPAWFTNPEPYDLYAEIEKLQRERLNADVSQLKNKQVDASLAAIDILNDPSQADPWGEASSTLEKSLQLDEASKLRNKDIVQTLGEVEASSKLSDAGFEELAKNYLEEKGYDTSAIKKKKEYKQFDRDKDLYEVTGDEATLIRPGREKLDKESRPKPRMFYNLDDETRVVDESNMAEVAKAASEGFIFKEPVDPFIARQKRKARESVEQDREARQPQPGPAPTPTPQVEYYRRRR